MSQQGIYVLCYCTKLEKLTFNYCNFLSSPWPLARGATKGGLEGAQAPPSLKMVWPVIRTDPMTFLLGGYLHLYYYGHFRYFTTAFSNSHVSDYQHACISIFTDRGREYLLEWKTLG